MSKVFGRVERQLLDLLDRHISLKGSVIITAIAGSEPSLGKRAAAQRALASLERKGFVESASGPDGAVWSRTKRAEE